MSGSLRLNLVPIARGPVILMIIVSKLRKKNSLKRARQSRRSFESSWIREKCQCPVIAATVTENQKEGFGR